MFIINNNQKKNESAMDEKTILIVEDERTSALLLKSNLEKIGYTVIGIAETGEDAIEMSNDLKPKLIIMDIMLPGEIDGIMAAQQIRELFQIPIIYLTGHNEPEIFERAWETDPYGYLVKPVDKTSLYTIIETALNRHRLELELLTSEEKYRLTIESTNDGTWNWKIQENYVYYSPVLLDILELDSMEPNYEAWESIIHPEDKERTVSSLNDHLEGKTEQWNCEHRLKTGTGTWKWVLVKGKTTSYDRKNEPLEMFGTASDISIQKRSEERLQEEKERAQTYLDIAGVMIVVINSDQTVALINNKGSEILGYNEDEIIGKNWFDTFIPEDEVNKTKEGFNLLINGNIDPVEYFENSVLTKDGKTRFIAWHNTIIQDTNGKIIGTLSSGEDITDKKQVQYENIRQKEFLNDVIEAISHPLYVINAETYDVIMANNAAKHYYGNGNNKCYSITHNRNTPCKNSQNQCPIDRVKKEKIPAICEHTHYDKEGNEHIFEVRGFPIFNENNDVHQIIEYSVEITERKNAENALKESRELFATFMNHLPLYAFIEDQDSVFLFGNGMMNDTFESFNWIGKQPDEYFNKELASELLSHNRKVLDGSNQQHEMLLPVKTGKERLFGIQKFPIYRHGEAGLIGTICTDITDQKQIQTELQKKDTILSQAAMLNRMGAFEYDITTDTLYLTDEFMRIYGVEKQSIPFKEILPFIHPEDRQHVLDSLDEFIHGKEPYEVDHRALNLATDQVRFMKAVASVTVDTNGNPLKLYGASQDVTEEKLSELAIQDSYERFKIVMNSLDAIVYVADMDTSEILFTNSTSRKLFGDNIEGKKCWQVLQKDQTGPCNFCTNDKLLDKEGKSTGIYKWEFQNTVTESWFDVRDQAIKWHDGRIVRMEIAQDITDRKNAELALMESEKRFKDISFSIGDFIWEITTDGSITYISEKIHDILGYSQKEALTMKSFDFIIEKDRDMVWERLEKITNEKKRFTNLETWNKHKNGKLVLLRATGVPILDKNNQVIGFRGTNKDITEEHWAREEIRKFKLISDRANYGAAIVDLDGNVSYINKYFAELHGYSVEELFGKNLKIFHTNDQLAEVNRTNELCKKEGSYSARVIWHVTRDGDKFPMLMNGSLIHDANGNPHSIAATATDIRDLIATEKALEREAMINSTIADLSKTIIQLDRIDTIAEVILEQAQNLTKSQTGYAGYIEEGTGYLICPNLENTTRDIFKIPDNGKAFKDFGTHLSWVLENKRSKITNNNTEKNQSLRRMVSVPALLGGELLGQITIANSEDDYTDYDLKVIEQLSSLYALAIKRMRDEKAIKESEQKYRTLYESLTDAYGVIDMEGKIIEFNKAFEILSGYKVDELQNLSYQDYTPEKWHDFERKIIEEQVLTRGYSDVYQKEYRRKDGTIVPVELRSYLQLNNSGDPIGIWAIVHDITERKAWEKQLKDNVLFFSTLIETIPFPVFYKDSDGFFQGCNKYFTSMIFGREKREVIGKSIKAFTDVFSEEGVRIVTEMDSILLSNPGIQVYEIDIHSADGTKRRFISNNATYNDKDNKLQGIIGVMVDISERTEMEGQIRSSLKEKEVLLQEVHHRVKNNMQAIASILRLGLNKIKDEKHIKIYKEIENRIRTMGLIHEMLYQTDSFSSLDFEEYVKNLIKGLFNSYGISGSRISYSIEIKDVFLGIETAIPCGLMINEIVTNCIKYAFPKNEKGEIKISLKQKNDRFHLIIKDNGTGLPENFDFHNTNTMGLTLVKNWINLLNGAVEIQSKGGTTFNIIFSELNYKSKGDKQ